MNGDALELAKMIQNGNAQLAKQLSDVRADMQNFHGNISARVQAVEEEQRDQKKKQWYHSIAVTILSALHHTVGSVFGWKL